MPVFPEAAIAPGQVGSRVVPYGYEFRDFQFGAGTDFITEEVTGLLSMAPARDQDIDRAHAHGVNPGILLYGKRILSYSMKIIGQMGPDIEGKLATAGRVFQPPRIRNSRQLEPLVFWRPGQPHKVCWVRCTKRDFPSNYQTARGFAVGAVEFQAPDPLIYALEESTSDLTLGNTIVVGNTIVSMEGDAADGAPPIIEITGPATNPIIGNDADDGRAIRLDVVLAIGDSLRVDVKKRKVEIKRGAGEWTKDYSVIRNDNQWWNLLPGLNNITYNRTGSAAPSTLTLTWNDVWN